MSRQANRTARLVAVTLIASLVASCGVLPRSGPSKRDIYASSVLRGGNAFVVPVDPRIAAVTAVTPKLGFSSEFRNAGELGADTIRPGDTLGLVIYENVEDGLLSNAGNSASSLDQIQVDSSGNIFIPYAGRVRAAGNTPEALRRIITERLDEQTPDPQVIVRRVAGDGATVSIAGQGGGQGVFAIDRPTRTLRAMLARAGGIGIDPEIARVSVTRGSRTETIYASDLFRDPGADIALRDGDTIFIERDMRSFTVLGATGGQSRLDFPSESISAIEALAQVGGLNPNSANPTGVFVYRAESARVASAVLGRPDISEPQRMIYVLDLTEPTGMFDARDFEIRDGDTIFVTEAPIVAFNRAVASLFGSLGRLNQVGATAGID